MIASPGGLLPKIVYSQNLSPYPAADTHDLLRDQVDRRLVQASGVELRDRNGEFRIRRSGTEQCHGGLEFKIVWTAENFPYGTAFDGVDQCGALPEFSSKDLVHNISDGLPARGDRERLPLRYARVRRVAER